MKPMKKTSAAAAAVCSAALAVSLALSGCASQGTGQPQSASAEGADAPEKLTLVLDYVPNTNHTGIYVAIDKGYYADAGLEVDVVQPPDDGADALVGSGKAQLGIGFQDVMANYLGSDDPLPVTAIAALVQHNTSGIASRQGEGIDRPAGLAGHAYGTWDQDVEKAVLRSIVETDGGDWDEVALVPANSTDEIAGLRTGTFDAAWVYEGWALQNAKVQGYPVDYFSIRSIDDTFDYYTPVVIANDAWLAAQPDAAAAFLADTEKGYLYASEHSDEAADILVAYAPETDPELARVSQEYLADLYVDDAPQWGYIDPDRWNRFYGWMNEKGLVDTPIAENAGFANGFLPKR